MSDKADKIVIGNDILTDEEYQLFKDYVNRYLDKSPLERLSEIEKELIKTLIYIDMQLKTIDEVTANAGFQRSVYEQKNNLIGQRLAILKQLSDIQYKRKEFQEEQHELPESITEVITSISGGS